MRSGRWSTLSIAVMTVMFGIMAGFFYTYTFNVNLAMEAVDGATYARVQSLFNQNVRHAMFYLFFFGCGAMALLTLALNMPFWRTPAFWLLVGASGLYIGGIIFFTRFVNLPLNYYTESWNPEALPTDWAATRAAWNNANSLRVGFSFAAFVACVLALTLRALPARINREIASSAAS